MVVTLQKLAETVFFSYSQRFQAESGPGFSYFSLRWDFSNWVILWLSLLHFLWPGKAPFKEDSRGYKYTYFSYLGTWHGVGHKAGSQAVPDESKGELTVHSGGVSSVKPTSRQQHRPQMLRATGSAVPKAWEVDLGVTQDHFRPHAVDLDAFMMCFKKHFVAFSDFRTITA